MNFLIQLLPKSLPNKIEITEVSDLNNDGAVDLADVEYLIKNNKNTLTTLKGDGDFRSEECIELLKEADIIVTNPPFSLFREFVAQLMEYDKKFLILENQNAITYKEVFPLLKDNKMYLGYGFPGNVGFFINTHYEDYAKASQHKEGMIRVSGIMCFTNLDIKKRHESIDLYKQYKNHENEYPKYDNYNAIEVSCVDMIPEDYTSAMGVPITFMTKFNPEQFEIIKFRKGDDEKDLFVNGKCPYFRIIIKKCLCGENTMEVNEHKIKISEIVADYENNEETGRVVAYGGKLNIRPTYQREFVYKENQQKAVIRTVTQGFPLNVMY